MEKRKIHEFMQLIPAHNRAKCIKMLEDHYGRFESSPGSLTKHQAWPGGYLDHLEEMMDIAHRFYTAMHPIRPYPFILGDAILVILFHDLDKPFGYVEPKQVFLNDKSKNAFICKMIDEYGIVLDEDGEIANAIQYIHGEGDDYHRTTRIQRPLAAFCHICDVASARIWYNYPKK